MASVRAGYKPVLIIVDVQVGVVADAWDHQRIVSNITTAVTHARAQGVPVLWVQHESADLPRGSPQWQWVNALVPAGGEALFHKRFESSFEETLLDDHLATLGATHIVLAGAQTNWCIRATAYAALERGYDLTLIKDAHTAETMALEDGSHLEAAHLVNDLNFSITWLRYPGRKNGVVATAELDFAAAAGGN